MVVLIVAKISICTSLSRYKLLNYSNSEVKNNFTLGYLLWVI